jgi:hypothetical protein
MLTNVQERNTIRNTSDCRCGRQTEFKVGNVDFFILERKITLLDVPHCYCSYCCKSIFSSKLNIDGAIKYAYISNLSEIYWQEFIN